jgi:hypothetical protein
MVMATRTKRTYNLSTETVARVRELAGRPDTPPTQDAVVELAIERYERYVRDREMEALWAAAANDPDFQAESRDVASTFEAVEAWPE